MKNRNIGRFFGDLYEMFAENSQNLSGILKELEILNSTLKQSRTKAVKTTPQTRRGRPPKTVARGVKISLRRPGRPRKSEIPQGSAEIKRGRGRPKKIVVQIPQTPEPAPTINS